MKVSGLRFFADQCVHRDLATFLRQHRCDVVVAADAGLSRADDHTILAHAVRDGRVLLTHDLGFGELINRLGHRHNGVLLLRPHRRAAQAIAQMGAILDEDIPEPPFLATVSGLPPSVRLRVTQA